MSRDLNKVFIIGHLGADPETRYMPSGAGVTNIRVATSERWKDKKTDELEERTEWHRIALFDKLSEVGAEYLHKGDKVYIEGQIRTRKWQDKEGNDQYSTEIIAREMIMLSPPPSKGEGNSRPAAKSDRRPAEAREERRPRAQSQQRNDDPEFDDIPF